MDNQYSSDYDPLFQEIGHKTGIDPLLLKAQAIYESGLNPKFKNPDSSASGLTAFTDATAQDYNVDRNDPRSSIEGQAKYLLANFNKVKDQSNPVGSALSAYKTGPNAGTYDDNYVKGVTDLYSKLKSTPQGNIVTTQNASTDDLDNALAQRAQADADPLDTALAQRAGANDNSKSAAQSAKPSDTTEDLDAELASRESGKTLEAQPKVSPEGTPAAPVANKDRLDLNWRELMDLQDKDPQAYQTYMDKKASLARGEASYGMGDIPRSIGKVAATVAPSAFNKVTEAALPLYAKLSGQSQLSDQEMQQVDASDPSKTYLNALTQRNQDYQNQFGNDPNATGNRLAGQAVTMGPVVGAAGKIGGALVSAAKTVLPDAAAPALDFLSGKVASNAVADPITGAVVKGATLGNRLGQYAASGTNAAINAIPFTGATAASSEVPMGQQLKQNAEVAGTIGSAAPAAYDAGTGIANAAKNVFKPAQDALSTKATNILEQLTGGPKPQLDTRELVPGSKPTFAEASGDLSSAALQDALTNTNLAKGEQLSIPDITQRLEQNDTARRNYLNDITGTPEDLSQAYKDRSAAAKELLNGTDNKLPIWQDPDAKIPDVKPVVDKIDTILKGPDSGNEAVQSIMGNIKNKLVNDDGSVKPNAESSEYVYRSVVKSINEWLENRNTTDLGQLAKAAKPQVLEVKDALNGVLKDAVPGYGNYLQQYAEMSKPIDQMELLQNTKFLNQPSDHGVPTLSKVNAAVDKINKLRASPTVNEAKSLTTDQMQSLSNLQEDLQRSAQPNILLNKPGNSATARRTEMIDQLKTSLGTHQNRLINPVTIGTGVGATAGHYLEAHGIPYGTEIGATVGGGIGNMLSKPGQKVAANTQNKLVELLLNPDKYSQIAANRGSLISSFGQIPQLQHAVSYGAPLLATGQNQGK